MTVHGHLVRTLAATALRMAAAIALGIIGVAFAAEMCIQGARHWFMR
jgi:hypothetical protein